LQLGRIRVGRDGNAVGHGGAQKNWVQVSPATVPYKRTHPCGAWRRSGRNGSDLRAWGRSYGSR
jgi:hypothetical protein